MQRRNTTHATEQRRDHNELRDLILSGAELQVTVRWRDWHDGAGSITEKCTGEVRVRRDDSGRWPAKPDLTLVANEDSIDDAGSILGSVARWLEAGRAVEVESDPLELAAALAALDSEAGA